MKFAFILIPFFSPLLDDESKECGWMYCRTRQSICMLTSSLTSSQLHTETDRYIDENEM